MVERKEAAGLAAGQALEGEIYLLTRCQVRTTRRGTDYLDLALGDASGEIRAKKWETTPDESAALTEGAYVRVRGAVESYKDTLQMRVDAIEVVDPGSVDPADFVPTCPGDREAMYAELLAIYRSIGQPDLRRLAAAFFTDEAFVDAFRRAPAASRNHHNYLGGLLEHVLSLARLADRVADLYEGLDRDLLLMGVLLHDVGKVVELEAGPTFGYTTEGELVGHVSIGVRMLEERLARLEGFPDELRLRLVHMILSHHGTLEWGAPIVPKTLEALVLHQLDNLDAKVYMLSRALRSAEPGAFTAWERIFGARLYRGR